MSNGKLTNKDLEVLTGIVMFLNENGFPPTVRELCNIFQDSIMLSDEKIREANRITFVKELMEEAV